MKKHQISDFHGPWLGPGKHNNDARSSGRGYRSERVIRATGAPEARRAMGKRDEAMGITGGFSQRGELHRREGTQDSRNMRNGGNRRERSKRSNRRNRRITA